MDEKIVKIENEFREEQQNLQEEIEIKIIRMENTAEEDREKMNKNETEGKKRIMQIWESIKEIQENTQENKQEVERGMKEFDKKIDYNIQRVNTVGTWRSYDK